VEKGVSRLGAELPYRRAAETYTALTRIPISPKAVEGITKGNGEALGEEMAKEMAFAMGEEIEPPGPREGGEGGAMGGNDRWHYHPDRGRVEGG